jgi:hypothetical protein
VQTFYPPCTVTETYSIFIKNSKANLLVKEVVAPGARVEAIGCNILVYTSIKDMIHVQKNNTLRPSLAHFFKSFIHFTDSL